MGNTAYYIWLILLLIYIISPLDLFPGFIDDIVAMGILYYLSYRKAAQKRQETRSYSGTREDPGSDPYRRGRETLSLEEAYRTLGVSPGASWEEVKKAYREKVSKCHPDKVSHLSEELQEKARELTLRLNDILEVIKRSKGIRSQH
ncbi:MAG: DnaJ domain-containing protein [Deferribacteres bacterium]|nr:DnaJ domain-containing protein [Deferribacteres bacterium]